MEIGYDDIRRLLDLWQLRLPVVRDMKAIGRDLFQISQTQTLAVISPKRKPKLYEVEANPHLSEQRPLALQSYWTETV